MIERGVVVKVKGSRATVSFDRKSACDSCHMCAVSRDGMKVEIVVENTLGALVGDFVSVTMGEKFVLTAATIVYIIPLVLVGAGLGIGSLFGELTQILLAVGGLLIGFLIAFLLDRFVIRKKKGFSPVMSEILPDLSVCSDEQSVGSVNTRNSADCDDNAYCSDGVSVDEADGVSVDEADGVSDNESDDAVEDNSKKEN